MDFVSVIVPCRNERKHIGAFLESLDRQRTDDFDWEIIIADGTSDDGTREILEHRNTPRLVVIDNPAQTVSAGLNTAIRMAKGNIIVRMDCHTEYASDYLQRCVDTLKSTGAENVGGPARTSPRGYLARAIAAAYHSKFSTGGARFHDETYQGWVDTVTYGCWWKATLERLGLFDESLVRNQDDELNLRLVRSGGKIWQSPEIVSWYNPRASLISLFRQYFQYGFWKIPVIRKHRLPASWRHLVPGLFLAANIGLLLLAPFSPLAFRVWGVTTVAYLLVCLLAAAQAAARCGWDLAMVLPIVFAVYHFSYGAGFVYGMLYWPAAGTQPQRLGKAFTGISR
ncbi:MAG TPA: glycosyltransferase family 2 protein [Bryobacteraceae bacterium]|nr:glycosyltransferase family 2 protein [Bryobacteraceae bacterium]